MGEDTNTRRAVYPAGWTDGAAYKPASMSLKGKEYVTVAERVAWFVHDQRQLIAAGLATTGYSLRTELVEHNPAEGFAQYAAVVRDVLGNEATMYGSCTRKSFADYLEKAATKALGRALLLLGYGTAFLDELDEGEEGGERKPVDAPQLRRQPTPAQPQPRQSANSQPTPPQAPTASPTPQRPPAQAQTQAQRAAGGSPAAPAAEAPVPAVPESSAPPTEQQAVAIAKLCKVLKRAVPVFTTFTDASRLIAFLGAEVKREQAEAAQAAATATATNAATNTDHNLREAFPAGQRGA